MTELLKHRLNNKNKKICYLGLILAESLMKNCGPPLHHAFCEKTFLDFVANLGRGKKAYILLLCTSIGRRKSKESLATNTILGIFIQKAKE